MTAARDLARSKKLSYYQTKYDNQNRLTKHLRKLFGSDKTEIPYTAVHTAKQQGGECCSLILQVSDKDFTQP